jgi:hypothetical protein
MLAELLGRKVDVVELKVDSKSTLALAKTPVFHERNKHIHIKYHFLRDCLEDGSIKASHIATTDQLADILTKSLREVQVPGDEGEDWAIADHLQCWAQGLGGQLINKPSAKALVSYISCTFYFSWLSSLVLGICSASTLVVRICCSKWSPLCL